MSRPLIYKAAIFSFSCLLFFLLGFFWFWTDNKTLPNTYMGSYNMGGLSQGELADSLNKIFDNFENTKVSLVLKNSQGEQLNRAEITYKDLGVLIDRQETANNIYRFGKSGNFLLDVSDTFRSYFLSKRIKPRYILSNKELDGSIEALSSGFATAPTNASIKYLSGDFEIIEAKGGNVLDKSRLVEDLKNEVSVLSKNDVSVFLISEKPELEKEDSLMALDKVKSLNSQRISLNFERDNWVISGDNLLEVLEFYPKGKRGDFFLGIGSEDNLLTINDIGYEGRNKAEMEVGLSFQYLNNFIDKIAKSIDRETVDASFVFDGEKVSNFSPAIDGRILDKKLTKDLILSKVSVNNINNEKSVFINLPVKVTKAKIADEGIQSLGIKELIGSGVSYFRGSIPNRIYNLSLGAGRISGTVVKPGDTFSFNKSVGDISSATGYKQAYVISEGRTVLDDGGGICQVSTTVFRAALNAGLPILQRTAHAYRVSYYEQGGFKPGIDATIWSPSVDLVFKNDTDHHILVQTVVDRANSKLEVDIYGTLDNRTVEISEPIVSNVKPALPDKYEDDPTLPKGTIKQVDFAAKGLTSVFGRKVFKNGELKIDEKFTSNFRPWQAVYLVGTGG